MITVNTVEIKERIIKLQSLIDEYEEIELNLFNQLKNSTMSWTDENSVKFEEAINLEKKETNDYLLFLKSNCELFDFIYSKYSALGKKISIELNNKSVITKSINNINNSVNDIINDFNQIDNTFAYPEYELIMEEKKAFMSIKNELNGLNSSITTLFNNVSAIETEIKNKIKNLDNIKLNEFNYTI